MSNSSGGFSTIVIDNYDSFTYNIVQYLEEITASHIGVFYHDKITVSELEKMSFDNLIISPGAGNPDGAGVCLPAIKALHRTKKILGVCLGHQCIGQFFGAQIVKAKEPMHGKCSKIFFKQGEQLFAGIKQGFNATRYHSLVIAPETLPECLIPIADTSAIDTSTANGVIMGIKHRKYPVFGVQFHPEAILTEGGKTLLRNFLTLDHHSLT
ncbi:glutamine amidotransferase [Spirochaetia bacterium]|nr:glutamine amidotransferase [Spirochaetia bacterium]